mmetsp:Transcript_27580/g.63947  ORF Transcript_27580/g.63947 Transcript_27580/m.63947 type:complete len:210 (-) Transcript_27580:168-797(-)
MEPARSPSHASPGAGGRRPEDRRPRGQRPLLPQGQHEGGRHCAGLLGEGPHRQSHRDRDPHQRRHCRGSPKGCVRQAAWAGDGGNPTVVLERCSFCVEPDFHSRFRSHPAHARRERAHRARECVHTSCVGHLGGAKAGVRQALRLGGVYGDGGAEGEVAQGRLGEPAQRVHDVAGGLRQGGRRHCRGLEACQGALSQPGVGRCADLDDP